MLAQPYGVELVGPHGVELVGTDTTAVLGMFPWQWMFMGAAGLLTATGGYVATRGTKHVKSSTAIAGIGGLAGGLLLALAFGRA